MSIIPKKESLQGVYGKASDEAVFRFTELSKRFEKHFDRVPEAFFSSPGRVEIIGNHLDHNGGRIIASAVNHDSIAAAAPNNSPLIRIISDERFQPVEIDINTLSGIQPCKGSPSLIAGLIEGVLKKGFHCEGFDACVSSSVLPSAGMSSSAAFEMLVLCMINSFCNNDKMTVSDRAATGQYAENVWWKKGSGMMDQMTSAHGGMILLDFSEGIRVSPLSFSFDDIGCDLILVNSGKGHADLSEEYSSIPDEMRLVASELGANNLSEAHERQLTDRIAAVRSRLNNDRAVLRSLHFYEELRRVDAAASMIRSGAPEGILELITASGNSSWKWLQNCYVSSQPTEQPVAVALAMTEIYIRNAGSGACRLSGGGFGGVMMCVLPKAYTDDYKRYMSPVVGSGNIHIVRVREAGAVRIP